MKRILLFLTGMILLLPGCAFHNGLTTNLNKNSTEVQLSRNNFKVTAAVQGESEATYVLFWGGLKKQALIAEARGRMLKNAGIVGGAKAIINETVEEKITSYLLVLKRKVIVSAYVVEFSD